MHLMRDMQIIVYNMADYDEVTALMRRTPGVSLRNADSRKATARYLERNPDLSFLAVDAGKIIGCAMCGHDGRRGWQRREDIYRYSMNRTGRDNT